MSMLASVVTVLSDVVGILIIGIFIVGIIFVAQLFLPRISASRGRPATEEDRKSDKDHRAA